MAGSKEELSSWLLQGEGGRGREGRKVEGNGDKPQTETREEHEITQEKRGGGRKG